MSSCRPEKAVGFSGPSPANRFSLRAAPERELYLALARFSHTGERSVAALFPTTPFGPRARPSARARRLRAFVLSLAVGTAASFGALELIRDVRASPSVEIAEASSSSIAKRQEALDRLEAQLDAARAKKPPALPAMPTYEPVRIPKPPVVQAIQVVYVTEVTTAYEHDKKYEEKAKHEEEKRREEAKKREEERKHEEEKRREEEHHKGH
jgi:hypothetical protein